MTLDDLAVMRHTFEGALADYQPPELYGVGRAGEQGWHFPIANAGGQHLLPAAVLATVLGYRAGNATLPMSREQLVDAHRLLLPAEACTDVDHPNLWAWRDLIERSDDADFVAVFIADGSAGAEDDAQRALLEQAAS
jgi:hypothetical protein